MPSSLDLIDSVGDDLVTRIARDLVRVEDIIKDKKIYGGITESQKQAIKQAHAQAHLNNISEQDIFDSITELCRSHLREIGPIGPVTAMTPPSNQANKSPAAAATGAQTNRPVTPADTAANISMQLKSLNPQELQRGIDTAMRNDPNLSKNINKSFADILAKMVKPGM